MKSSIKFYFDEHIAGSITKGLRRRGVDVLTIAEAGKLGAEDKEHFAFARQQQRIIVTHDADFCALLQPLLITRVWFMRHRNGRLEK